MISGCFRCNNVYKITFSTLLLLVVLYPSTSFSQPNWQFIPSLTISEEYDSNVYSTSSASEDYVSKIGANLNAAYNGHEVEFKGGYLLSFNSYANQPEANAFTHGGNLNIGLNRWFYKVLKGGGLSITEAFTFTPDLTDSNGHDSSGNYGIKRVRSDLFRNSAAINITIPTTQSFSLNASYSNTLTDYRSSLYKDNITNTLGLGAGYSLKKDTLYGNINISSARAEQEDSTSYSISFGLKHPFSQSITLDANAGVSLVAPESGEDEPTMRGSIGITKRMEWHTFSTGYSRSLNAESGISGTPVAADVYYLNLSNIHTQYLSSSLGANYSSNRSIKGIDVDTQSYTINGNMNYTIRKWLSCSFSMSHFNQMSKIATISEMNRNQITFSIISTWL